VEPVSGEHCGTEQFVRAAPESSAAPTSQDTPLKPSAQTQNQRLAAPSNARCAPPGGKQFGGGCVATSHVTSPPADARQNPPLPLIGVVQAHAPEAVRCTKLEPVHCGGSCDWSAFSAACRLSKVGGAPAAVCVRAPETASSSAAHCRTRRGIWPAHAAPRCDSKCHC
jgi:hypothetical protein